MKTMKYTLALILLAGGSAAAMAADPVPAEVQALYERTCSEWSKQSWIAPDARNAFYDNCLKDIPLAVPSGYEEGND